MPEYVALRACTIGTRFFAKGEAAMFPEAPSHHWRAKGEPEPAEPMPYLPPDEALPPTAASLEAKSAYHDYGRANLLALAKERGIEGSAGMKVAQLIRALEDDDKRLLLEQAS